MAPRCVARVLIVGSKRVVPKISFYKKYFTSFWGLNEVQFAFFYSLQFSISSSSFKNIKQFWEKNHDTRNKGKLTCVTKRNRNGFLKMCTVQCDDCKMLKGPQKTRGNNYDNRNGIAYLYWHTNKNNRMISCN